MVTTAVCRTQPQALKCTIYTLPKYTTVFQLGKFDVSKRKKNTQTILGEMKRGNVQK